MKTEEIRFMMLFLGSHVRVRFSSGKWLNCIIKCPDNPLLLISSKLISLSIQKWFSSENKSRLWTIPIHKMQMYCSVLVR